MMVLLLGSPSGRDSRPAVAPATRTWRPVRGCRRRTRSVDAAAQVDALATYPEHLRDVSKVERLLERCQHFDMTPVDPPMALQWIFTEASGGLFPGHGSECLVGLGTVPLGGQKIVGTMLLDDADGGVASGVQRIEGKHRATDRNHLQQCPDRRQFAVPP